MNLLVIWFLVKSLDKIWTSLRNSQATLNEWANRTLSSRNISVSNKEQPDSKANNQTKEAELAKDATSGTEEADKHDDIGDISISNISDVTNTTLTQNNITKTIYDTHQYYNSTFIVDAEICKKYWVDLDKHPEVKVNNLLSKSHRRAAVRLFSLIKWLLCAQEMYKRKDE